MRRTPVPTTLDIRLDWDSSSICLSIRDHGVGVPLAIAEQIGKPFFTTKGKGFGLGLFQSGQRDPRWWNGEVV